MTKGVGNSEGWSKEWFLQHVGNTLALACHGEQKARPPKQGSLDILRRSVLQLLQHFLYLVPIRRHGFCCYMIVGTPGLRPAYHCTHPFSIRQAPALKASGLPRGLRLCRLQPALLRSKDLSERRPEQRPLETSGKTRAVPFNLSPSVSDGLRPSVSRTWHLERP